MLVLALACALVQEALELSPPTFTPPRLDEIRLGPPPPESEIRDVLAFGFDAQSRIRFARREEGGTSLVVLEGTGSVRSVTRVHERVGGGRPLDWFPLASPHWIATVWRYADGDPGVAWRVDETSGEVRELPRFPTGGIERALELDGDRLLVLLGRGVVQVYEVSRAKTLPFGDTPAPPAWLARLGASSGTPADDVALTTDGNVVLLGGDGLRVLTREGREVRAIDLGGASSRSTRSSVVADHDGGVLVHDFGGEPPLRRLDLAGNVRAALDARMADGTARADYRRNVRVAPDGRMWTTDGHDLVRLDADGVADLALRTPARTDVLEAPGRGAIDSAFGRVLVQDQRTRALHVFDGAGQRLLVCRPRPEDLAELRFVLDLGCTADGGVFADEQADAFRPVRFGPDGTSRGSERLVAYGPAFVPGSGTYWGRRRGRPMRVGHDGESEIALDERSDGRAWRDLEDIAVSREGIVAVLDLPARTRHLGREHGRAVVARFDAQGTPLSQHELPDGAYPSCVEHAGPWILAHSHGGEPWLVDTRDGRIWKLDLEAEPCLDHAIDLGFAQDGSALWLVQDTHPRLRTYALPE